MVVRLLKDERTRRAAAVPPEPVALFTTEDYHAMIHAGILTEDDPVELLDGWLVPKMPKNPRHRRVTRRMRLALERLLPAGYFLDTQEPYSSELSEPEPDLCIGRVDPDHLRDRHWSPAEIALLVEISDATLKRDRNIKRGVYAGDGIPVYWIVNLVDNRIEVHSDPDKGTAVYRDIAIYDLDSEIPLALEGVEIAKLSVRDLLA